MAINETPSIGKTRRQQLCDGIERFRKIIVDMVIWLEFSRSDATSAEVRALIPDILKDESEANATASQPSEMR